MPNDSTPTPAELADRAGLLSVSAMARLIGIDHQVLSYAVKTGKVPGPDHWSRNGLRRYYHRDEADSLRAYFVSRRQIKPVSQKQRRLDSDLLNIKEAARLLLVDDTRLGYAIENGHVPPPTRRMPYGLRAYYHRDDLPSLRAYFDQRLSGSVALHEERRQAGFYSRTDVAEMAGTCQVVLYHHEKAGRIPPPSHPYPYGPRLARYYTRDEAEAIVKLYQNPTWKPAVRGPRQHQER